MLPEKRNLDRARANKDDRAGRYLLSDSNSRRRSQVQFFRPSSSSNGCSWISKFNLPFKPSFLMHGPDGTGVKCRDRNCEGRGVVAPEVQKRSDRSTRKSKKNPKNNKKVHGNSNEPPMTPLPQLPPENTELSLPVLMEQVTSAPTTSMATVTEGLETATPEASTLYFKYITRDPTAAIPTEIIVLNPTGPVSPISSPTHSVDASPTSSGNPQPGGNFFNNPAAVAGVAVGATRKHLAVSHSLKPSLIACHSWHVPPTHDNWLVHDEVSQKTPR